VAGREIIKMKGTQKGLLEFDADEFVGVPPSLIRIRAGSEVGWILLSYVARIRPQTGVSGVGYDRIRGYGAGYVS
jgi:hypothetical protein